MSGFSPGEGWQKGMPAIGAEYVSHGVAGMESEWWVREEPMPPLPTEPWTVIEATWLDLSTDQLMFNGSTWHAHFGGTWLPDELREHITSFTVLSAPASVRQKAVLDAQYDIDAYVAKARTETARDILSKVGGRVSSIARTYGVEW